MTETLTRSREWLLLNAVEAWLYHYEGAGSPAEIQYKELQQEFHDAYMQTLHKDAVQPVEDEAPEPTRTTRKRSTTSKQ